MNERLYEELDYCVPLGIPHSAFLSWSPIDQDKALAYRREMRTVCGGCGTRKVEWEQDSNAYVGHLEYCEGCSRRAAEDDNLPQGQVERRGWRTGLVTKEYAEQEAMKLAEKDQPKPQAEQEDAT